MESNKDSKNLLQRKELEQHLAFLQFGVLMRQRTGQPDSDQDIQAIQRVTDLLSKLSIDLLVEVYSNPKLPSPNGEIK